MKGDDPTRSADGAGDAQPFGPYRLIRKAGEGGMGEVWLAEQLRPVRRQVAIKIIKAGMDTAQVVARFEAERQALALMDHPGIAHVFDAGATPEGRPYFAMEYVAGEPITEYCRRQRLPLRECLDLFLHVCDAVQHAHQKGIIHRDLKPSNILVTLLDGRPVPKIIDFGVAKATSRQLSGHTLFTELGAMIGTPEYMSPEQAELTGLDVDTRSDVYSLGVVLYELLTGSLPFDRRVLLEQGIDFIRKTIRETDPPRPSLRVTTGSGGQTSSDSPEWTHRPGHLRGDLDWIVMKALEKDRTRRYGSASDLGADLRRHLADEPVLASPPSVSYRVGKFARRHRIGVAMGAAVFAMLVVFSVSLAVQAQRIRAERDRANREALTARRVADFMAGLFQVSDPSEARGATLTAREILDRGAREVTTGLAEDAYVKARLQLVIGGVYTNLGSYTEAEQLLVSAVKSNEATLGPDHPDTLTSLNALANVYWYLRRWPDAEPLYKRVLSARTRLFGPNDRATLTTAWDLASLFAEDKRLNEAEALQRQTFEAQRQAFGEEDPDTVNSLGSLAAIEHRLGRFEDAVGSGRKALALKKKVFGADHPSTLHAMHNLATDYEALRRFSEAETLYVESLEIKRRVSGLDHQETARTEQRLAGLYTKMARYAEAEPLLLHARQVYERAYGPTHERTREIDQQLNAFHDKWVRPKAKAP